ncbi:hypothetical protein [Streptomyces sp. NBC_00620]|uniref:hypothetical protein n=1 Tax=Streptomyces sp. NBC_00620 TaxID=2903666 RepID=UPI002255F853|nr:hypothetical protein [Streptomyces sp. NBC_00620]MCX4976300.1 hypothetical protein [Streptomyces sp. NBC_00620]
MAAGTTHPRAISVGCTTLVRFSVRTGAVRGYVQGLDEELTDHDHVLLVRHGHSAPEATQKILPLTEALLGSSRRKPPDAWGFRPWSASSTSGGARPRTWP